MTVTITKRKVVTRKVRVKKVAGSEETAFSKWYKSHKETYNERRRKRYENDPEYRERMIEATRKARTGRR